MTAKISVIIPVYNVEPYLRKCVDSVLSQTYSDLEIILVDDGSTDGSGSICDEYANKDLRIKVIHQSNAGQAVARNFALDIATGDWIAFLDSDDWIEPEMYETLLGLAIEHNAEIVSCKSRNCYLNSSPQPVEDDNVVSILSLEEMVAGVLARESVRFEIWNKLWKRSLIGNVRFKRGQLGEEVFFDRLLFLKAKKMVAINKTLHNYLILRPGNTNTSFKTAKLCIFDEFGEWAKDLEEIGERDAAKCIQYIAADFAIAIYEAAVATNQTEEIKQTLKRYFKQFYVQAKGAQNMSRRNKARMLLFNMSPALFSGVRKMISAIKA